MLQKELDAKKVYLVTGAAGFIGMHLAKALLENDCTVIGIDNLNEYYDISLKMSRLDILSAYKKFSFYKISLEHKEDLFNLFNSHKIDIIINLAAQAGVRYSLENPDAYVQSNLVGFLNILEAAKAFKVEHLLYASSSSVYGANKKVPFSVEDRTDSPVSLYAATKKSNELMAYTYSHLYKIPTTGLRFFTVYGPFGRPDMAYFSFTKAILEGETIKVYNNGDMLRDFTYIDDIVNGIVRLITGSPALTLGELPYRVYNIGNNQPEKLMDFIQILEKYLGREANKTFLPMQKGDVYMTYADIDDLMNDVGFRPSTSLETGLKLFVDWYLSFYR